MEELFMRISNTSENQQGNFKNKFEEIKMCFNEHPSRFMEKYGRFLCQKDMPWLSTADMKGDRLAEINRDLLVESLSPECPATNYPTYNHLSQSSSSSLNPSISKNESSLNNSRSSSHISPKCYQNSAAMQNIKKQMSHLIVLGKNRVRSREIVLREPMEIQRDLMKKLTIEREDEEEEEEEKEEEEEEEEEEEDVDETMETRLDGLKIYKCIKEERRNDVENGKNDEVGVGLGEKNMGKIERIKEERFGEGKVMIEIGEVKALEEVEMDVERVKMVDGGEAGVVGLCRLDDPNRRMIEFPVKNTSLKLNNNNNQTNLIKLNKNKVDTGVGDGGQYATKVKQKAAIAAMYRHSRTKAPPPHTPPPQTPPPQTQPPHTPPPQTPPPHTLPSPTLPRNTSPLLPPPTTFPQFKQNPIMANNSWVSNANGGGVICDALLDHIENGEGKDRMKGRMEEMMTLFLESEEEEDAEDEDDEEDLPMDEDRLEFERKTRLHFDDQEFLAERLPHDDDNNFEEDGILEKYFEGGEEDEDGADMKTDYDY